MALTDSLTGLANRRHLDSALKQEVGRAKRQGYPLSLIMLDVDHFKRFNDRYGHLAGDECLQDVAGVIKRALKRPADTAARYGGEEFTVLLPDTDMPGAIQVAQEILQAIVGLGIAHSDNPCAVVTASAGVSTALATSQEMTPAGMIKAADACLYYAKHSGRNRIHAISAEDPLLPLPS
jgi:diguanylate cyclase